MAHAGGRPLKFKSVKEMQDKIDDYFATEVEELWTITGLALHLDTYRELLCNYEDSRPEFSDAIKKAKEKVQNAYERDLRRKGRSGDIFALKNFGWKDKQEVEQSGSLSISYDASHLAEAKKIIDKIKK